MNSSTSSHLVHWTDCGWACWCDWPNNEMEDGVTISRARPVFLAGFTLSFMLFGEEKDRELRDRKSDNWRIASRGRKWPP